MAIVTREKLYLTPEAAKFLKVAEDTVRKYIQRGLIKPLTTAGHAYLIEESELRRYNRERRGRGNPHE